MDSHTFGFRHAVYDRMTFKEVYDADKTFVRFVLGLSKPRETSEDLWLFQIYCRQRELIIDSSVVAGDVLDEGIVPRGEDSSGASVAFVPSIVSAGRGVSHTKLQSEGWCAESLEGRLPLTTWALAARVW